MLEMRNFSAYHPENGDGGLYLRDDQGRDWYEWSRQFQPDTLKVLFNDKGVIQSLSWNGWDMNPDGGNIAEVARNRVPEKLKVDGSWVYRNGAIVQTEEGRAAFWRMVRGAFLAHTDLMMTVDYTIHDEYLSPQQVSQLRSVRLIWKQYPRHPMFHRLPPPEIPAWILREAIAHGFDVELLNDLKNL